MQLRKAERKQAKLRIGLSAPSGAGKTYSALKLARGLADSWDKIAIIDTENGSAELYSDLGTYNVLTLEAPFSPERYIEAIQACEKAGMQVIILDSATHEWDGKGGLLETNELLAQTKFKGNTWAAWSVTTPKHRKFIEAITTSPCHIITTVRSKTDTIQTEDKKIKKVGMKEIQREGYEYELTINFNIDRDGHYATASKDRTGLFIDLDPFVISEETGKKILEWNQGGAVDVEAQKVRISAEFNRIGIKPRTAEDTKAQIKYLTGFDAIPENFDSIIQALKGIEPKAAEENAEEEIIINEPFGPEETKETEPKPAPEPEDNRPIGKAQIGLLKELMLKKQGITDEAGLLEYMRFIYELEVADIKKLTQQQATKAINDLLKQPNMVDEPEEGKETK